MCLITPDKKLYVAEEDIIVYKILNADLTPYFHKYKEPYVLGKLNETTLKYNGYRWHGDKDYKWFYGNLVEFGFTYCDEALQSNKILRVSQGFHSYESLDVIEFGPDDKYEVLVKCTIPKGAEYHTSPFGYMVSNKLIINEIINK